MDQPRRSNSSLRMAAVTDTLAEMQQRLRARLDERVRSGHLDVSAEQLDVIVRVAKMLAHDAVVDGYDQGRRDGRLRARLELGSPADEDSGSVASVRCPTCRRAV